MAWVPTTDFEEEIISSQPDHNFILGTLSEQQPDELHYPRPKAHLDMMKKKKQQEKRESAGSVRNTAINAEFDIIEKIQMMAGTKPIGELTSLDDWDKFDTLDKETSAMMRYFGYGPSHDEALNPDCTIGTVPVNRSGMHVMRSGRISRPLLYDEKFFKMENIQGTLPSDATSDSNADNQSDHSAGQTRCSDDNEQYWDSLRHMLHSDYERIKNASSRSSGSSEYFSALDDSSFQLDSLQLDENRGVQDQLEFIPTRSWHRTNVKSDWPKLGQQPPRSKSQKFLKPKELYERNRR